ncbi:hypothetical protein C8R44DRAFT_870725 [Mycena epipterygia]|nr:hypothetical protein C8R44DRAFT_870725 [Mycena epipterygia]
MEPHLLSQLLRKSIQGSLSVVLAHGNPIKFTRTPNLEPRLLGFFCTVFCSLLLPLKCSSISVSVSGFNAPHLTHSRRPSALGQGVPIKNGVSIPRNIGVKQESAIIFGSIDDDSAPISSSPAATPDIKSEDASISKPIAASTSASTSSTPPPSTPTKLLKVDVRMFFQGVSLPAPPSQPENSSASMRPSNLPQQ